MGIELNITNSIPAIRAKPQKKVGSAISKKMTAKASKNGFTFEFGAGSQKVKAIVARKRPVAKSLSQLAPILKQKSAKNEIKEIPMEVSAEENTPAKNTTEDKLDALIDREIGQKSDNLMLNVCLEPPTQPIKKKLTKEERFRLKREGKSAKVIGKVLTKEELSEGLQKYSQNPNKQPRVADVYFQKEREERNSLKEQEGKEELELGKVDPNARKVNAFRVKRTEDSSVKKINLFTNNPDAQVMGQRAVKPIKEKLFDGTKVENVGLHPHAVKNLADLLSITELTTVQRKTIPKALEGRNILVRSQTGSGKTLAYALPLVNKLQAIRPKVNRQDGIMALVIVPTRELAVQTYELFIKLLKPYTWLVPGVLMGGEKRKAEKARLRKGINILVGTPGRLVDHLLHTTSFKLGKVNFLVLDEADRLLELGYERDVKEIVEAIDKHRAEQQESVEMQRMLLSATLTAAVQRLAGLTLENPVFIDNSDEGGIVDGDVGYSKDAIQNAIVDDGEEGVLSIPENLKLNYVVVPPKLRLVTLSGLLAKEYAGKDKFKAIIFMSTMEMVNFHYDVLNEQLTKKILDEDDEEAAEENSADEDNSQQPLLSGLRFFK